MEIAHSSGSGAGGRPGRAGAELGLVNLPTRPPGHVPAMKAREERARLFRGLAPDLAISAGVEFHNLLDHVNSPLCVRRKSLFNYASF